MPAKIGNSDTRFLAGDDKIGQLRLGDDLVWMLDRPLEAHVEKLPYAWDVTSSWTTIMSFYVIGSGRANFSMPFSWGGNGLQWISYNRQIRICRNGAQQGVQSQNATTGSWSGTVTANGYYVEEGDRITVEAFSGSNYTGCKTVNSATLTMTPV
ncbi:hypothetical protein [Rhodococcus globerulus]|uniref:hypothetical protein n=1 Tax=Rhodococcus globerulus TaxID=33008 RepID=UPI00301AD1F5